MRMRFSFPLIAATLLSPSAVAAGPPAANPPPGSDVFGQTKMWHFDITISAKEYDAMQPAGGGFFGGPPGGGFGGPPKTPPPKKANPDAPARDSHRSVFNMEFPIVRGEFASEGKTYTEVAYRYKGNGSYLPTTGKLKRNLKVEFDRYNAEQRFHGLKTLNLNAGAADTTKIREIIAYAIYRDAGIPAPRTALAEVTLTVPNKYDKELLGFYTVVEQVDRTFLKRHFKDNKGLLMKPERMRGLDYLGDDWERYKNSYLPKNEATKEQAQRVIDFVKLINRGDDTQFRKEIASYLDIDQFLRFMAVTAMIANMDSMFSLGHNYYMYLNPDTNKFVFIPWDLDLALAGFPFLFSPESQIDLSLTRPYAGEFKLTDRLFAMKDMNDSYQKTLKELAAKCFTKERLLKDIAAVEGVTKELIARETKAASARREQGGFDFAAFGNRTPDLRTFADKRIASITAQLEGKSKGQVPVMGGFGGPGGPRPGGPAPRPGDVLPGPLQDMLRLTAEQRKRLAEIQKSVDEQLDKLLTDDQRAQLKRLREAGPGGFGPPPGGPGFPKGPPKGGQP
jgi:hypothetical protein